MCAYVCAYALFLYMLFSVLFDVWVNYNFTRKKLTPYVEV